MDATVPSRRPGRIPSLDGLRAVSISLVVIYHIWGARFPGYLMSTGNLGVRIFFVISGFLISGILLKEMDSTGKVSLKKFYTRRALRIFPAFYVYCIAVGVSASLGAIQLHKGDLIEAATYVINFFPGPEQSVYVKHIWSLCVEEQFYLIWPAVLCFAGKKRGLMAACGCVLVVPLIRLAYWFFVPSFHDVLDRRFETVADALATGCLLTGGQAMLSKLPAYNAFLRSKYFLVVPVAIYLDANFVANHPRLYLLLGETVLNIGIALCIDRWVRYPGGVVGRILNSSALTGIGVMSYSLYLWQQPFVSPESADFIRFPLGVILACVVSLGSFFLIETPFQRLKTRMVTIRT
jgi:peptidoglycan/LPS O-acetylase OafA/YrhL